MELQGKGSILFEYKQIPKNHGIVSKKSCYFFPWGGRCEIRQEHLWTNKD